MKQVLQLLIQIQEIEYVLLEQEGFEDPARLEELEETLRDLRARLPANVDRLYEQLKRRGSPAVAVALEGRCSVCSVRMPTSQQRALHLMETLERCQSCRRILYDPGVAPQQLRRPAGERRAGIARFTSVELMHPHLEATTAEEAIAELVQRMVGLELVSRPDDLVESALRRERLASTALDKGIAIPHVRGVEGGGLTFALGLSKGGFAFDPAQDDLTHIVFFFLVPTVAASSFLGLLAGLVRVFREQKPRSRLLACTEPAKLFDQLAALTEDVFR